MTVLTCIVLHGGGRGGCDLCYLTVGPDVVLLLLVEAGPGMQHHDLSAGLAKRGGSRAPGRPAVSLKQNRFDGVVGPQKVDLRGRRVQGPKKRRLRGGGVQGLGMVSCMPETSRFEGGGGGSRAPGRPTVSLKLADMRGGGGGG